MLKSPARKPNFFQAASRKLEIFFEKANGLDFSEVILSKNLGYDDSIVHKCSPSGNKFLSRLLQDLTITNRDRMLDIGCGKGSAIRCMTKFPFQRIDGVEIAKKIANIAQTNFEKLGIPNVKIFNTSAIEFDSYGDYNFFYMYNPFPEAIMKKVIAAIKLQVPSDQEILIIYNNPTCHETLAQNELVKVSEYPDQWGNGIFIYSNRRQSTVI